MNRPGSRSRMVNTSCCYDCGSRCILRVVVNEGIITEVSTDDGPLPGLRACPGDLRAKKWCIPRTA